MADSDLQAELEEALTKARPIARALGADLTGPRTSTPLRRPAAKRCSRRPDPAKGLLETIAIRDGTPVDLDRHLEHLARSVRALYERELPSIEIPPVPHGRIRILARPDAREFQVDVEVHADLPEPQPVVLEPRRLAGGLGAHKWLDRPQHQDLLIADLDGSVLEAAWANVLDRDPPRRPGHAARRRPDTARHHPPEPAGGAHDPDRHETDRSRRTRPGACDPAHLGAARRHPGGRRATAHTGVERPRGAARTFAESGFSPLLRLRTPPYARASSAPLESA
jgi:hypothetical protein